MGVWQDFLAIERESWDLRSPDFGYIPIRGFLLFALKFFLPLRDRCRQCCGGSWAVEVVASHAVHAVPAAYNFTRWN
jgi:hypothetical protein